MRAELDLAESDLAKAHACCDVVRLEAKADLQSHEAKMQSAIAEAEAAAAAKVEEEGGALSLAVCVVCFSVVSLFPNESCMMLISKQILFLYFFCPLSVTLVCLLSFLPALLSR